MNTSNYPKRFEILENNGNILKFRVGELTRGMDECFMKHFINDEEQGNTREINIPKILEYTVSKSGKHTFSFFKYNPDVPFNSLADGIDTNEDNGAIWEQDIFVITHDSYRLFEGKIETLAEKYAPFVFMDKDEEYLPASLDYLLNRDKNGKIKDENLKVDITLRFPKTKDIHLDYNDLSDVLPFNGHKHSKLDTIGFSVLKLLGHKTKRDALDQRKGEPENVTVYYSFIPNPRKKHQVVLNYHFLYAYDPKQEERGSIKFASHIFDRESISIVFNCDQGNPDVDPKPEFVIYGAHLEGQTMGSGKKEKDGGWTKLQTWKCGRVKVMWEDVYKIKDNHPCVAVAKGSHAPYPAPGHYAVYFGKRHEEEAATGKVLCLEGIPVNKDIEKGLKEVINYKLKDLKLGNITSKSVLAYSGYLVDILGPKDAKFPPFTKRELEIDTWVNGDNKDKIHEWKTSKVEETAKNEFEMLIHSINSRFV